MNHPNLLRNPTVVATLVIGSGLLVYAVASVAAPKLLFMYKTATCISSPVECLKTVMNPGSVNEADVVQETPTEPVTVEPIPTLFLRNPLLTSEQCEGIRTEAACDLYFERNNAN